MQTGESFPVIKEDGVSQIKEYVLKAMNVALGRFRKEGKQDAREAGSALFSAIREGNSREVARLLGRPATDPGAGDPQAAPAGADPGRLARAAALVNVCNSEGESLLHCARTGQMTRWLIEFGADVTIRDREGKTALHKLVTDLVKLTDAEKAPLYECMDLLLAGGADRDACDKNGNRPLIDAVKLGDASTVAFLLENGADPNTRDPDEKTPLHWFFSISGPILVRHINRQVDLRQIEVQIAEALVRNGADVNARDNQGRTPLAVAAGLGNVKAAEFLLKNGADVNARDNDGKTPLHLINTIVADRSSPGQIAKFSELLVQGGADVNARDDRQRTPLFFARLDCMEVLLACGADIDARDEEGKTPIFCVKSQKCLETLIARGADIQAADRGGKKYLDK